jgi:hypothetical protein
MSWNGPPLIECQRTSDTSRRPLAVCLPTTESRAASPISSNGKRPESCASTPSPLSPPGSVAHNGVDLGKQREIIKGFVVRSGTFLRHLGAAPSDTHTRKVPGTAGGSGAALRRAFRSWRFRPWCARVPVGPPSSPSPRVADTRRERGFRSRKDQTHNVY